MPDLSAYQHQALNRYYQLMAEHPQLFTPRRQRPIVQVPEILEAFVSHTGITLGVTAETPYLYFVVDLLEDATANSGHRAYLRILPVGQLLGGLNVAIVAVIQNPELGNVGDLVLIEQERHATGQNERELPRGFGEAGLSGEANALKELGEETGYTGTEVHYLGTTCTDTGTTDSQVNFYYVVVTDYKAELRQSDESIQKVLLAREDDVWRDIQQGRIRDGMTLQGLALLNFRRPSQAD